MRDAFADELTRLAPERPDLVLLAGDIGNKMFERFKAAAPGRFFNCGVAEANMMSVAGGMAMSGLRPVVYTITPFVTTRCLEQIRNDVCYHDVPVIIVGVGSGLGYAGLGPTHHSCEDMALLRSLPGMTVLAPADPPEVRALLAAAVARGGPTYMRIGKKGEPHVHTSPPRLEIGKAVVLREGRRVCLISTGVMLPAVLSAAALLEAGGLPPTVMHFHTVKPLDLVALAAAFGQHELVVSIEEHSIVGGFGSAVAEWHADRGSAGARLSRLGTADAFFHEAGSTTHARKAFGLTPEGIAARVHEALRGRTAA